ncbi:MAG: 50S ribosomal protein L6 [Candidatus Altiarchaeota archaeon]
MKNKSEKNVLEFALKDGVDVQVDLKKVTVKGSKGEIIRTFKAPKIKIERKDNTIVLKSAVGRREQRAKMGSIRAHIKNMMNGVSEGVTYKMKIVYSHFPMTVKVQGTTLLIDNFLGEKFPRKVKLRDGVKVDVKGQDVTLTGINKEDVSQSAASIEQATDIKRMDPRVFQDGIYITEKDGTPVK